LSIKLIERSILYIAMDLINTIRKFWKKWDFMAIGKIFSTFMVYCWWWEGVIYYTGGLGKPKNLHAMFIDAQGLETTLEIPFFALYIIAGIFILFLASGVLQILGMKSRVPLIIGTIKSLGIGSLIWLGSADVINRVDWIVNILGTETPLIEGIIPMNLLGIDTIDIWTYLLYAGGIIRIVAAVYGP